MKQLMYLNKFPNITDSCWQTVFKSFYINMMILSPVSYVDNLKHQFLVKLIFNLKQQFAYLLVLLQWAGSAKIGQWHQCVTCEDVCVVLSPGTSCHCQGVRTVRGAYSNTSDKMGVGNCLGNILHLSLFFLPPKKTLFIQCLLFLLKQSFLSSCKHDWQHFR